MTATIAPIRNAGFPEMLQVLQEQQARKIDVVVPAAKLAFVEGQLQLTGLEQIVEDDGVTDPNGLYLPTSKFDDSVAERLDIAPAYLRRLREGKIVGTGKKAKLSPSRLDLYDANVNGLLHGRKEKRRELTLTEVNAGEVGVGEFSRYKVLREAVPADTRSFLVRLFRGDASSTGIARALLSNRYARLDNLDGLMAMLQGIQEAGIDPETLKISGDLTETRMYVHVAAPEIMALAPKLLEGYRSPFDTGVEGAKRQTTGLTFEQRVELGRQFRERGHGDGTHNIYQPGDEPIVHAGFKLTNSEVGNGRWQIQRVITILKCSNGLTLQAEGMARAHLGSTLEDGNLEWSADTQSKELALVTAQTRDVVKNALSQEALETAVAKLEENADAPVEDTQVEVLTKRLKFTEEQQAGILRHFLMGGQGTAAGVANAITSFSQTLDPDAQFDLDNKAVQAMEMAASLR